MQRNGTKRQRSTTEVEFDVDHLKESLDVTGECLILGIDEAGRGPIFGPMVYAGAMISIEEHKQLIDYCHVADSKILDEHRRLEALRHLQQLKTLQTFTVIISAEDISATMTGCSGRNLNTLSHDAAISIISKATIAGTGKLCAAYVDTVGPPESYQKRLSDRFPHLFITVSKRADDKYPIVSAASIIAKTQRDQHIEELGLNLGSGYPSDLRSVGWLRTHLHRFFVIPRRYSFVRHSWAPVMQLARDVDVCVQALFHQDRVNDEKKKPQLASDRSQRKLTFIKTPPDRAPIFTHMLKLEGVDSLSY